MSETAAACFVAAAGVALCFTPSAPVALAAATVVVLGLPAWAAARALVVTDREADLAERLAASFGGLGVSCVAIWLGAAVAGLSRATVLGAPVIGALLLGLLGNGRLAPSPPRPEARRTTILLVLLALAAAVLVSIPFLPYGWERADGVHRMGLSDWYLHLMVTSALDAAPSLPPRNPYLASHQSAHYHYGFHLVAAAIHRAAGRQGDLFAPLLVLTLLTAAGVPLVLFVLCRRSLGGDDRKALVAAAAGTLLCGFDLVVWAARAIPDLVGDWPPPPGLAGLRAVIPSAHLDHWIDHDERQFNAPYVALLWAPHYVAAVVTTLLAIHALRSERPGAAIVPVALLLASLPALSIYVAMTAVVAAAAAVVADLATGAPPWRSAVLRRWGMAGLLALVFATPIFVVLRRGAAQHFAPLVLHVSSAGSWHNGALFTEVFGDAQWARLLDTPALYFVELGIVGVLGAVGLVRRVREGTSRVALEDVAIAVVVFVFLNFVRPPVGGPNNLNFRPMLVVWAMLLPGAAETWFRPARFPVARMIGLAISVAALPCAVAGPFLEGYLFWPTPRPIVEASRWINGHTPPEAIVAIHPDEHVRAFGYWLRRQAVEADHRRNALMLGAPAEDYERARRDLREAYATADGATAARRFSGLGADVVLARVPSRGSPPWSDLPCFDLRYRNEWFVAYVKVSPDCAPEKDFSPT